MHESATLIRRRRVRFAVGGQAELAGELLFSERDGCSGLAAIIVPGGCSIVLGESSPASGMRQIAEALAGSGVSTLVFDGRGFGQSTGSRTRQQDYLDDLAAAIEFMEQQVGVDRLGLMAYSAGGAAAFFVAASDRRVRALCCYGTLPSYSRAKEDGRILPVIDSYWKRWGGNYSYEQYSHSYGLLDPITVASQVRASVQLCGGDLDDKYFRLAEQLELARSLVRATAVSVSIYKGWDHRICWSLPGFAQVSSQLAAWMVSSL